MNTFTYTGSLTKGIKLEETDRGLSLVLGYKHSKRNTVVHIGQDRNNPAEVIEGTFFNGKVRLVTPFDTTKSPFKVLEKDSTQTKEVLVRVKGFAQTNKNGIEVVASGDGYQSNDELVIMRPGQVMEVGVKIGEGWEHILFFNEVGELICWTTSEYKVFMAKKQVETQKPEILFSVMPFFTYKSGELTEGLITSESEAGTEVILGQTAPRTTDSIKHYPVIGLGQNPTLGAIGKVGNMYVFCEAESFEEGKFLVRVDASSRGLGKIEVIKGQPEIIGNFVHRTSVRGDIWSIPEQIVVLSRGDVLYVNSYVVYISGDKLQVSDYDKWQEQDVLTNPEYWNNKGVAHVDHIPDSWIGKMVKQNGRTDELIAFTDRSLTLSQKWSQKPGDTDHGQYIMYTRGWEINLVGEVPERNWKELEPREARVTPNPLFPNETKRICRVQKQKAWSRTSPDNIWVYVKDVPCEVHSIPRWEVEGRVVEGEAVFVREDVTDACPNGSEKIFNDPAEFPDGFDQELEVEFISDEKLGNIILVYYGEDAGVNKYEEILDVRDAERNVVLSKRRQEMEESLSKNAFVRQVAVRSGIFEDGNELWVVPCDIQGVPCEADKADHWEQYSETHSYQDVDPKAFTLWHRKGYQSKTNGATSSELIGTLKYIV